MHPQRGSGSPPITGRLDRLSPSDAADVGVSLCLPAAEGRELLDVAAVPLPTRPPAAACWLRALRVVDLPRSADEDPHPYRADLRLIARRRPGGGGGVHRGLRGGDSYHGPHGPPVVQST